MKIGISFGGYCPLHRGHLDNIMTAKKNNDIVYVVVCGYDNEPRANEIGLNLAKRYQLVKEFFKDDEIIRVITVNDTKLGIDESMSINNWSIWLTCVLNQIAYNENIETFCGTDISLYVGEQKYMDDISKVYDNIVHGNYTGFEDRKFHLLGCKITAVMVDKTINVSGTAIRNNPHKYWSYIAMPFRRYMTKSILVLGTASEGKTTLVRDISNYFNIPHVEEYGRTYMAEHNMKDTDLTYFDFVEFIINQNTELKNCISSTANNNGIVISDTDNLITLMYAEAYIEDDNIQLTQDDYYGLHKLVKLLACGIKWEHIFIIPPGNTFVDDGTRYMVQSSIEERRKNYEILLQLIDEFYPQYKDSITFLDPKEYNNNYMSVKHYIQDLLNE